MESVIGSLSLTDEQLVAWDRDVVPFLPHQPVDVVRMFGTNDRTTLDVRYVTYEDWLNSSESLSIYGTWRDFFSWDADSARWLVLHAMNRFPSVRDRYRSCLADIPIEEILCRSSMS